MSVSLESALSSWAFGYLIVFCRLGAALMLLPGFGDFRVPMRVRLLFGLVFSALILPSVFPNGIERISGLDWEVWLIAKEVVIGLFIGAATATLMAILHVCGAIAAAQIGLSNALTGELFSAEQGVAVGALLMAAGLVIVFSTGLDHLMLQGIARSYLHLPIRETLSLADASKMMSELVGAVFATALRLSAPFILLGLLFNIGLGVANRAFPQLPAFFLALPASLAGGLFLLMLAIATILLDFGVAFQSLSADFLR